MQLQPTATTDGLGHPATLSLENQHITLEVFTEGQRPATTTNGRAPTPPLPVGEAMKDLAMASISEPRFGDVRISTMTAPESMIVEDETEMPGLCGSSHAGSMPSFVSPTGHLAQPGLSSSQSNPTFLPSFISPTGHLAQPEKKPIFQNLPFVSQQLSLDSFRSLNIDPNPIVKPRILPPFYEKSTSFSSDRPADEIFRAVGTALAPFQATAKPHKGKYKCQATIQGQCIAFQVHLFEKLDGGHLVEFQRRRGCPCAFWHLFHECMESLAQDLASAAAFVRDCPSKVLRKRASIRGDGDKNM